VAECQAEPIARFRSVESSACRVDHLNALRDLILKRTCNNTILSERSRRPVRLASLRPDPTCDRNPRKVAGFWISPLPAITACCSDHGGYFYRFAMIEPLLMLWMSSYRCSEWQRRLVARHSLGSAPSGQIWIFSSTRNPQF
jgi:hypothetical protein